MAALLQAQLLMLWCGCLRWQCAGHPWLAAPPRLRWTACAIVGHSEQLQALDNRCCFRVAGPAWWLHGVN